MMAFVTFITLYLYVQKKEKKSTQKLSNRILINIKSNALKSFALFNPEKLFKETNKMGKKKSQA